MNNNIPNNNMLGGGNPQIQQAQQNMPQNPQNIPQQQQQQQQQQAQQQAISPQAPSTLCRYASEMLQQFLTRTMEIFQILRTCSPHVMNNKHRQDEQRNRVRDLAKALKGEMTRIRAIYYRIKASPIAEDELSKLLDTILQFEVEKPLPWDSPSKFEEYNSIDNMNVHESRWFSMKPGPQITDENRADNPKIAALEQQYQELYELNAIRTRQLKEVILQMRQLVWSTNDMLAMRKP